MDAGSSNLFLCPGEDLLREFEGVWPSGGLALSGTLIKTYPSATEIPGHCNPIPDLCFLDAVTCETTACAVLQGLQQSFPELPVISIHQEGDSESVLRFMRQGAADFLVRPLHAEQVRAVLLKTRKNASGGAGPGKRARLVCVVPAKGACGATTLAATLAFALRKSGGKSAAGRSVLLADMDPLTGTLAFLLKLKPAWSFVDALARDQELDADVWGGLVYPSAGIDVLLSPEKPDPGLEDLESAAPLLRFARSLYDWIVVDAAGAYGSWSLSLAQESDELFLAVTTEAATTHAAKRVLGYWDDAGIDRRKIQLIVNRSQKGLGMTVPQIQNAVGLPIALVVPSDYGGVNEALLNGEPLGSSTPVGKAIAGLAERLRGPATPPLKPTKSDSSAQAQGSVLSHLFGLFGKR